METLIHLPIHTEWNTWAHGNATESFVEIESKHIVHSRVFKKSLCMVAGMRPPSVPVVGVSIGRVCSSMAVIGLIIVSVILTLFVVCVMGAVSWVTSRTLFDNMS